MPPNQHARFRRGEGNRSTSHMREQAIGALNQSLTPYSGTERNRNLYILHSNQLAIPRRWLRAAVATASPPSPLLLEPVHIRLFSEQLLDALQDRVLAWVCEGGAGERQLSRKPVMEYDDGGRGSGGVWGTDRMGGPCSESRAAQGTPSRTSQPTDGSGPQPGRVEIKGAGGSWARARSRARATAPATGSGGVGSEREVQHGCQGGQTKAGPK